MGMTQELRIAHSKDILRSISNKINFRDVDVRDDRKHQVVSSVHTGMKSSIAFIVSHFHY